MNIILYILATILGVFGIWTICLNWKCFWYTYVKKEKVGSWIPIVPGALLMIANFINTTRMFNRMYKVKIKSDVVK